jgi:uroporphyrinogen decarboxylase
MRSMSSTPTAALPYIRTILQTLRQEVGNDAAVLGFVGSPWTLAAYAVEGQTSKNYTNIKGMAFSRTGHAAHAAG